MRKRARSRKTELDDPPETVLGTPLSSVKRRKVSAAVSSPSTPKAIAALKKSIPALSGTEKPNQNEAGDSTSNVNELDNDIWEVEVSESENEAGEGRIGSAHKSVSARTITSRPTSASATSDVSTKRGRGTPRKSDILARAKAVARKEARIRLARSGSTEDDGAGAANGDEPEVTDHREQSVNRDQQIRSSGRKKRRARRFSEEASDSLPKIPKGILTPSKGKTKNSNKNVAFQDQHHDQEEIDLGFRDIPSGDGYGNDSIVVKPKKRTHTEQGLSKDNFIHSTGPGESEDELSQEQPNGLALQRSPSKSTRLETGRSLSREIVDSEGEEDNQEEEEEEEEEIACAICSGLDSEEPNQILLCDNCDFAAHQFCCNVQEIPEGDWLCEKCQPTKDPLLHAEHPLDIEQSRTIADDLPEIDGFEIHLRKMQRALLDKLTGQVRIKLTGHDEELQKVHQVVEQTVVAGEGNSMLIIGARGSGKTTVRSFA